jgi:hypothetical protein
MPSPQPKTNVITKTLNELRNSEVDSFTISRLEREIEQIPVYDERYMLLGILSAIKNDTQSTVNNFEKSLLISYKENTCENFIVALDNLKQYSLARLKAYEFNRNTYTVPLIKKALNYSYLFLELDNYISIMDKLNKMNISLPEYGSVYKEEINVMTYVTQSNLVSKDELTEIGCIAMNAMESLSIDVTGNSISLVCDNEEKLRIKYYIDHCTSTDTVLAINDSFIDGLIDKSLDTLPVVVLFIRNPNTTINTDKDRKAVKVS